MERTRQYVSLSIETMQAISEMAKELNMTRVDVIETIIVVYFEYVKRIKKEKRQKGGT